MENATLDVLKTRRSFRAYKDAPVEREKLEAICEAATFAPTGMGKQAPYIVVVEDKNTRDTIAKLNAGVAGMNMDPFYGAPVLAIVFADTATAPTWAEDAALVAGNLLNAAHAVGVDSCYIWRGNPTFKTDEGKALMASWGLPDTCEGVAICILGYGEGETPEPKPRKADYVRFV